MLRRRIIVPKRAALKMPFTMNAGPKDESQRPELQPRFPV
ncbi:hypothetical protein OCAR_7410 [Afipia carboxidovorans OM5]|nr:hypothetical protein OCAR_7410 [Afipia carboxidovorans OM5]